MKICPTCLGRFDDRAFCPDDGTELRQIHTDDGDKMLGRVLDGRWLIEEKIGEGGMGAVYRGEQTSVGRPIAVKTLLGSLADTDEYVERFFREANVASTLNDPHCVTIYDFGQDAEDHALYLAMEFLDGRELSKVVREDNLTLRESLTVGVQICSALAAAHQKNIVHRDLKPENIFLVDVPGGKIFTKVLDFGIAKIMDSEASTVTRTGQIFGTPAYMSPEQCQSADVDERSDLYAVGVILYELVSGRPPFGGDTPLKTLIAHVNTDVKPPSRLGAVVPAGVEAIIMRLLEKKPGARFQKALDVREALEEQLEALSNDELDSKPAAACDQPISMAKTLTSKPRTVVFDKLAADGGSSQVVDLGEAGRAADDDGEKSGSTAGRVWVAVGAGVLVAAAAWMISDGLGGPPDQQEPAATALEAELAAHELAADESSRDRSALVLAASEVAGERVLRATTAASAAQAKHAVQAAETKEKNKRAERTKSASRHSTERTRTQKEKNQAALDSMPEVLTEKVAQRIIASRNNEITGCFEKGLLRDSDFSGRVVVKMVISAEGEVANAKVVDSSVDAADIESCIIGRVEAWAFPATIDGRVKILQTPFSFQAP